VEIVKDGPADAVLSGAGVGLGSATFTVLDGRLAAIQSPNPVEGAVLHPAGGEIVIGGDVIGDTVTYANAIESDGGTITAGGPGAENVTVNITDGLTLTSGDLALRTDSGNSLNVTGPVTGAGSVDIGAGASVALAGGGPYVLGGATVSGGVLTTDNALEFDKLDILSGTFTQSGSAAAGERNLTIADSLTLTTPLDMTGASLSVDTATVKVAGVQLTVDAPLSAAVVDLSENGSVSLGGNNIIVSDTLMLKKGQFIMSGGPALVSHGDIGPTTDPTQLDLSGGTMLITGLGVTYPNQLNYAFYDDVANDSTKPELLAIDDGIANGQNGGLFTLTPTPESLWPGGVRDNPAWTGEAWTGEVWQQGNVSDYYSQMWWGTFNAPETGDYTFYVHGDDWEILWMDLNHNGDFELSNNENVTSNPPDGSGGGWDSPKTVVIHLDAGESYDFALAHNEGGGGDWIRPTIQIPSMSVGVRMNPSAAEQAGWWSVGDISTADIVMPTTDLLVTADSTVEAMFNAELGVLKVDGERSLVFDVRVGKTLTFQSTELTGSPTGLTLDVEGKLWLTKSGGIDAGGAATINKDGSGELILTEAIGDMDPSGGVLNINDGTLVLGEPGLLAGADIQLGGGLKLSSPSGSPIRTYAPPLSIVGDSSIIAGKAVHSSQIAATIIYDNDLNAGASALTLGSVDGYTLNRRAVGRASQRDGRSVGHLVRNRQHQRRRFGFGRHERRSLRGDHRRRRVGGQPERHRRLDSRRRRGGDQPGRFRRPECRRLDDDDQPGCLRRFGGVGRSVDCQ